MRIEYAHVGERSRELHRFALVALIFERRIAAKRGNNRVYVIDGEYSRSFRIRSQIIVVDGDVDGKQVEGRSRHGIIIQEQSRGGKRSRVAIDGHGRLDT